MRTLLTLATALLLGLATSSTLVLAEDQSTKAPANDTERSAWAEKLAAVAKDDLRGTYKLALQLEAQGFEDLAAEAYERVLALEPDHAAARRALGFERVEGRWLTGEQRQRAKGLIHHEGRWVTSEEFAARTRPQREAADQKAGERKVWKLLAIVGGKDVEASVAARRELGGIADRFKLAPLAKSLRAASKPLRLYAARELARLADPLSAPALLKRAVNDPDAQVRQAVVDALRAIDSPSTVHPLGRALESKSEAIRVHAAQALEQLGDELGAAYLIKRWEGRSGNFPQAYISQVRQISYIQDFDVEVASTSFIADPIVGVIQEGVVQGVKIHSTVQQWTTVERAAVKGALHKLVGEDLGRRVEPWIEYWRKHHRDILARRSARHARAGAEE